LIQESYLASATPGETLTLQLAEVITLRFQWEHMWADTQEGAIHTKQKSFTDLFSTAAILPA